MKAKHVGAKQLAMDELDKFTWKMREGVKEMVLLEEASRSITETAHYSNDHCAKTNLGNFVIREEIPLLN